MIVFVYIGAVALCAARIPVVVGSRPVQRVHVVNGFIEVYDDPIGYRGSWESVVSFKDLEATKRIATVSGAAQWFEDNSPLMDAHNAACSASMRSACFTARRPASVSRTLPPRRSISPAASCRSAASTRRDTVVSLTASALAAPLKLPAR